MALSAVVDGAAFARASPRSSWLLHNAELSSDILHASSKILLPVAARRISLLVVVPAVPQEINRPRDVSRPRHRRRRFSSAFKRHEGRGGPYK